MGNSKLDPKETLRLTLVMQKAAYVLFLKCKDLVLKVDPAGWGASGNECTMWLLISPRKAKNCTSADVIFLFLGSLLIYIGKSKALILTCCNSIINSENKHQLRLQNKKNLKKSQWQQQKPPPFYFSVTVMFSYLATPTKGVTLLAYYSQNLRFKSWRNI